jgi:molybdate transport system regulatory protein
MTETTQTLRSLKMDYKIWFTMPDGSGLLGDGKWKILKKINETGSLVKACEELGITYRRTWNDLKKIEARLGFPVLETSRGGPEGGHTRLTAKGIRFIRAFDTFHQKMDLVMQQEFKALLSSLD